MRRAAKIDANQPEIVAALRKIGVSVAVTKSLGDGFPDLVAADANKTALLEVKMPGQVMNMEQLDFVAHWKGEWHVVRSVDEALAVFIKPAQFVGVEPFLSDE